MTPGVAKSLTHSVGRFSVVVPPLARQADFGEKLSAVHSIQSQQSTATATATAKAQATFDALLARCFTPTVAAEGGSSD